MAVRRRQDTTSSNGPARWQSTPYVKGPNKKLKPVHDPQAGSQRQDHTGHGCAWDRNYNQMRNDKRNVTATGRVLNPKTGRMHKTSSAKAGDANTRVCPTCGAVVKGNAWHLNKHMTRHK